MKEYFLDLFEYNFKTNSELALRFKSYDYQVGEEIVRLANHILNAQQVWLSRINQEKSLPSAWEDFPLDTFERRNQLLHSATLQVIAARDIGEVIPYRNFADQTFENKISVLLTHLVNHSTYHRGQIAMLMRTKGMEPIMSDYIYFKR